MTTPMPVEQAETLFQRLCEELDPDAFICDKSGGDLEYLELVVEFMEEDGMLTLSCFDSVYSLIADDANEDSNTFSLMSDLSDLPGAMIFAYGFISR